MIVLTGPNGFIVCTAARRCSPCSSYCLIEAATRRSRSSIFCLCSSNFRLRSAEDVGSLY